MSRAERRLGVAAIVSATVLWSFSALAIKFLTGPLDQYTQNFVRFTSAAVFLWAVCLVRSRREALAGAALLFRVLPAFAAVFVYQYGYVRALYMENVLPGLAYMLTKSTAFFTAVLSVMFFADERTVFRDRRFLIGAALSVTGLGGFVALGLATNGGGAAAPGGPLIWGILLVLFSALMWSLYTVLIKLLVRSGSLLVTYTYICTLMAGAFGVLAFAQGSPGAIVPHDTMGVWVLVVTVGSGALFVGAAHVFYYYAIRALGTTISGTVSLGNTFLTPLLSVFLFGERLTWLHVLSGAVLVAGAVFTLQARRERGPGRTP